MSEELEKLVAYAAADPEILPEIYGMVAEIIRARLDPEEAAIVARWFDRLAAGEPPAKVFPKKGKGRPRDATTKPRPDDVDIYWLVHFAVERGVKAAEAKRRVAKAHGMSTGTVHNIYSRIKNQGGP